MRDFLMDIAAAQAFASAPKAANRRRHALQVVGGIGIAMIIGAALVIVAAFSG